MRVVRIVLRMGAKHGERDDEFVQRVVDNARWRIVRKWVAEHCAGTAKSVDISELGHDEAREFIEEELSRSERKLLKEDMDQEEEQIRAHFSDGDDRDE